MNLGIVMRSPKFRILLYIIIFGGACMTVLLLHNTHSHLKEAENLFAMCQQEKEKCNQGKDSMSAQLQVLYEQKKRLEMTLQQEHVDHQKAKEGMEKKSMENQAVHSQLQKEMSELQSKYSQLSSDYKALKEANELTQSELSDMKESYASLEKEKQNLNLELSTQLQTLHQQESEVNQLNDQLKIMSIEKQQRDHENAERIKKYNDNLTSCQKQHQQLLLQLDEVSSNLSNCITGKNKSKQGILDISQKQIAQNTKISNILNTREKNVHEMEANDKSVNNQVRKKVRNKYSQNDYVISRGPNSEPLFIQPNAYLHFDQNRQQNHPLSHQLDNVYDIHGNKVPNLPLYQTVENHLAQNDMSGPIRHYINNFQKIHNSKNQPKESGIMGYPFEMPHPVGSIYALQKNKASFDKQTKHDAVIHGHIVE